MESRVNDDLCPICYSPLADGELLHTCPGCGARYHEECWNENGGCGVYGCSEVPPTEHLGAAEIPVSYWGRESKPCPACGEEILAAAVRCKHCGATFRSARPESQVEFHNRTSVEKKTPELKRVVIWLFVLSIFPFSAPLAAVAGSIWYSSHRSEINTLPGAYPGICKIALGVGTGQSLALLVLAVLYAALR